MIVFLPAVGYSTVAINYVFEPVTKKKQVSVAFRNTVTVSLTFILKLCAYFLFTADPNPNANN